MLDAPASVGPLTGAMIVEKKGISFALTGQQVPTEEDSPVRSIAAQISLSVERSFF